MLSKLDETDAHARALAYLVCRTILASLSGEKQIDAAHKIVTAMNVESLDGMEDFLRGSGDLQVVRPSDASLVLRGLILIVVLTRHESQYCSGLKA